MAQTEAIKMTPLQMLISELEQRKQKADASVRIIFDGFIEQATDLLPAEEKFAEDIWEAAKQTDYDHSSDTTTEYYPDFAQFYSQFQQD